MTVIKPEKALPAFFILPHAGVYCLPISATVKGKGKINSNKQVCSLCFAFAVS